MTKRATVVCHFNGQIGNLPTLTTYLSEKKYRTKIILHPLDNYNDISTTIQNDDDIVKTLKRRNISLLNYFIDLLITVKEIRHDSIDVYFGCSNLDTVPAIISKKLFRSKIEKIIYYPRDYSENRFSSKLLNYIYNKIETYCVRNADITVSNTFRAESRRKILGLSKQHSLVIQNPVLIEDFTTPLPKILDKRKFIYVGDVSNEHGLYDIVQVLASYISELVIIGIGTDLEKIITFAQSNNIKVISFKQKSHEFTVNYMKNYNGFGLAPYNLHAGWTYYCSPLKVSEYIACGIPVVMSSVPEISGTVIEKKLGIVYSKIDDTLTRRINKFDSNDFHIKALEFYDKNNRDKLYKNLIR